MSTPVGSHSAPGSPSLGGAANVFGALALALADRMADEITLATGRSRSEATALSALYHFLQSPSVDRLRQVLGLTHSGTVRLLDGLVDAGYIERRPGGPDRRWRQVRLTPAGRRAAKRVASARAALLTDALGALTPAQQGTFGALNARVLVGIKRGPGAVRWICRLCDTHACGRDRGECPLASR